MFGIASIHMAPKLFACGYSWPEKWHEAFFRDAMLHSCPIPRKTLKKSSQSVTQESREVELFSSRLRFTTGK